jgi:hypothetical protein
MQKRMDPSKSRKHTLVELCCSCKNLREVSDGYDDDHGFSWVFKRSSILKAEN